MHCSPTPSGRGTASRRGAAGRTGALGVAASLLLLAPTATAEWVDWVLDGELAAQFDSNANRSAVGRDEEWNFAFEPAVQAGRVYQLAERTRLVATAEIGGSIHVRFHELDAVRGGGRLALLHKFGLGDAPWARVFARGGYEDVGDDRRSGPRFSTGLVVGRRLTPRLDVQLSYTWTRHWGEDGPRVAAAPGVPDDVWDLDYHVISADGSFLLTERLVAGLGFAYRRGDFDSNARSNRFDVLARRHVQAVALDEVFGDWVYRIRGNGYTPWVSLNYGLGDRWSLDLRYRFSHSEGGGGLDYDSHGVRAMLLFRY